MSLSAPELADWLKTLLQETFDKLGGESGYMLDKAAPGLLGTLEKLSAEEASSAVKAHAFHVAFIQEAFIQWLQGLEYQADWSQSWPQKALSETDWNTLNNKLQAQHQLLMELLEKHQTQDPLENAVLLIAHSAYHLGAIRQIIHHH